MNKKKSTSMSAVLQIALLLLLLLQLGMTTAFAADGKLDIKLEYSLSKYNYIQGNPLMIVALSSGEKVYCTRLNFNGTLSAGSLTVPQGDYSVTYYTAAPGKESACEKALKKGVLPDAGNMLQVSLRNQYRSLFGGGILSLVTAPESVSVKKATVLKLTAKSLDDSFIPALYINPTEKMKGVTYSVSLYRSNKDGKKLKRICKKTSMKAKRGYYLEAHMINTYPGHYYYLMEMDPSSKYKADASVLIDTYVAYAGEKLSVKRVDITKGGKKRSILVDVDSKNNMVITIKDPDSKNAEYLFYSSTEKYPAPAKDGSYKGTPIKMKKVGSSFSIAKKPQYNVLYSFNIVKKVKGTIDHNYHINIPYYWTTAYGDGHLTTRWRMRPRVGFTVSPK